MKTLIPTIATGLLSLLTFTSCSSVNSAHPLTKSSNTGDLESFDGAWTHGGMVFTVEIPKKAPATLAAATLAYENDKFDIIELRAITAQGQHGQYISVLQPKEKGDNETPDRYMISEYSFEREDTLLLWPMEMEAFAKAVEGGQLKGKVHENKENKLMPKAVTLSASGNEILEYLNKHGTQNHFDYKSPTILKRIPHSQGD
ncbi:hypothetical protein Rhal01_02057 [Rubritalea halochordaticola]|uniref:Secreted protein n=1 Tax=Rubritalea halochordaticola TaxID=714537 RepID=A0ABP9V469_9BACT